MSFSIPKHKTMNALVKVLHDILLTWTFFTRLPAPHFMTDRSLAQALWALPLISLLVAFVQWSGALALLTLLEAPGIARDLAALALFSLPLALTGGLHWDGLADLADGLGVGKDRRATVMRDPTVGAFAVLTLLCLALAQFLLYRSLLALPASNLLPLWLLLLALTSRQFMALVWASLPPADTHSQASRLGRPSPWLHGGLFAILILVLWLVGVLGPLSLLALVGGALAWRAALGRWLGGINGDGLGASQVIGETFVLLIIVLAHA